MLEALREELAALSRAEPPLLVAGGATLLEDKLLLERTETLGAALAWARITPRLLAGEGALTCLPRGCLPSAGEGVEPNEAGEVLLESFEGAERPEPPGTEGGIQAFLPLEGRAFEAEEAGEPLDPVALRVLRRLVALDRVRGVVLLPGGFELVELFADLLRLEPSPSQRVVLFERRYFGHLLGAVEASMVEGRGFVPASSLTCFERCEDPELVIKAILGVRQGLSYPVDLPRIAARLTQELPFLRRRLATQPGRPVALLGACALSPHEPALAAARAILKALAARETPLRVAAGGSLAELALEAYADSPGLVTVLLPEGASSLGYSCSDPLAQRALLLEGALGVLALPGDLHTVAQVCAALSRPEPLRCVLVGSEAWSPWIRAFQRTLRGRTRRAVTKTFLREHLLLDAKAPEALAAWEPAVSGA